MNTEKLNLLIIIELQVSCLWNVDDCCPLEFVKVKIVKYRNSVYTITVCPVSETKQFLKLFKTVFVPRSLFWQVTIQKVGRHVSNLWSNFCVNESCLNLWDPNKIRNFNLNIQDYLLRRADTNIVFTILILSLKFSMESQTYSIL